MSRFRLRPVLLSEQALVHTWRNHPAVRRVMPDTNPLDPQQHKDWWPTALADPNRRMMMLEDTGTPVALIVFLDLKPHESANWGFYATTSHTSRADLLAIWIAVELAAIQYAFDHLHLKDLFCETRETNKAVLLLHGRTGFVDAGPGQPGFIRKRLTPDRYNSLRQTTNSAPLVDVSFEPDPRDLPPPKNLLRTSPQTAQPHRG